MKIFTVILTSGLLFASCGGNASGAKKAETRSAVPVPKQYTYTVRKVYPHLTTSYTQGLQYIDGILWEGTGEYGHSVLQKINLETGKATVVARLPRSEFGEGITLLDGKVYQLTWQSNKAYVYDAATGEKLREHRYPGEGWGLTTDGSKLYMSDGSENIYTLDPATFKREKRTTVTLKGEPVRFLNELEWIDGKIWANVYKTEQIVSIDPATGVVDGVIVIIDPATGVVEGVIDLSGILPEADVQADTDVLNGIAYDAATGRIFVTGKKWDKLFEIGITEK